MVVIEQGVQYIGLSNLRFSACFFWKFPHFLAAPSKASSTWPDPHILFFLASCSAI